MEAVSYKGSELYRDWIWQRYILHLYPARVDSESTYFILLDFAKTEKSLQVYIIILQAKERMIS
jgi:hypothetical protein